LSDSVSTIVKDASTGTSPVAVRPYEAHLDADLRWALDEGSLFFHEKGSVHEALRKITRRLDDLGIPYALAGGMALFFHGYRRFTEDLNLIVRQEDLDTIHDKLEGLGYVPPFARSKNLRDVEFGVKIEFSITGGYPGDGKPKPVAFPNPVDVVVEIKGVKCVQLPRLVELKLASGMTQPARMKDLGDVVELIKSVNLPSKLSEEMNPYVRAKYLELWSLVHEVQTRFIAIRPAPRDSTPPDAEASLLTAMQDDGVRIIDRDREWITLATTDPEIAKKYDMHDESEMRDWKK
jgi:Nucleotidyl transferase AbiEii toxin, Type IV TA system